MTGHILQLNRRSSDSTTSLRLLGYTVCLYCSWLWLIHHIDKCLCPRILQEVTFKESSWIVYKCPHSRSTWTDLKTSTKLKMTTYLYLFHTMRPLCTVCTVPWLCELTRPQHSYGVYSTLTLWTYEASTQLRYVVVVVCLQHQLVSSNLRGTLRT